MKKDEKEHSDQAPLDTGEVSTDEGNETNKELEALKAELAKEKEAKLMALADLDNFRKRVEKQRQDLILSANMSILNSLAELVDDFNRMIEDLEVPGQEDRIDAFKPVLDKAKGIMADYGVVEVEIKPGDKMNPSAMEAIGTTDVQNDADINTVIHVAQKGYKLADKGDIIRHAKVIIGKKSN